MKRDETTGIHLHNNRIVSITCLLFRTEQV